MCRFVIDIYNSRVRYFKQLALGVSIVFKGFVIVKMILREIGKQCYVEMTSVYPPCASAWEETSITQYLQPLSTISLKSL